MAGYSKEFLIDVFLSKYINCSIISVETIEKLERMATDLYDKVGRDKFRVYASVDAQAIKDYRATVW